MIGVYNGHVFDGTDEDLCQAQRATCATCGKVIKDRHGPIASDTCDPPARATGLEILLAAAKKHGAKAERARVIRIRNACFTGMVLTDELRAALARFDGMLLRGEDVSS